MQPFEWMTESGDKLELPGALKFGVLRKMRAELQSASEMDAAFLLIDELGDDNVQAKIDDMAVPEVLKMLSAWQDVVLGGVTLPEPSASSI